MGFTPFPLPKQNIFYDAMCNHQAEIVPTEGTVTTPDLSDANGGFDWAALFQESAKLQAQPPSVSCAAGSSYSNPYAQCTSALPYTGGWGTTCAVTPQYYITTDLMMSDEIDCPLPEDVLEKLLMLGMKNSKKVLADKLREAYKTWCKTQKINKRILPVLLIACIEALKVSLEEEDEKPNPNIKGPEPIKISEG